MAPDMNGRISGGGNLEKQIERQMGCMTGFLQLFERHQILAGKRAYSAKRLPCSPTSDSLSPSERSDDVSSTFFAKAAPPSPSSPSLGGFPASPENNQPAKSSLPLPLPVFELKDGIKTSWKLREAPRLSLDSRAVFDARGKLRPRQMRSASAVFSGDPSDCFEGGDDHDKHRRSPSVVARLMGLDALPVDCNEEQHKRSELRRSASESRVSRDLWQYNFEKLSPNPPVELFRPRKLDYSEFRLQNAKPEPPRVPPDPLQRKTYFEAQEFFPEPKRTGSMYDEIEKRLRMRGIEEPAKDLETLKQILEALQLKGLLHTKLPELPCVNSLNVISNYAIPISSTTESPIIRKRPTPKLLPTSAGSGRLPLQHRSVSRCRPAVPEVVPSAKSRRNPAPKSLMRPPELNESSRSPISSPVRRRPVNVEGKKPSQPARRVPAVQSPVASPKSLGSDHVGLRYSRIQRPKPEISSREKVHSVAEDYALAFSDAGIISRPVSQFDFQRASTEECGTGRTLLERCDKLLHSIAAITSSAEQVASTDQQPSPVSVLESNFLSEENTASPLPRRSNDFKAADWDDRWNRNAAPSAGFEFSNGPEKEINADQGDDYAFVAAVVRETDRFDNPAGRFSALEQHHLTSGSSMASVLHRRHVYDTVTEIVERKRHVNPWTAFTCSPCTFASTECSLLQEVWEEVQWLRNHTSTDNVVELTERVIKHDMAMTAAGEQDWTVSGTDMSAAVLHIERQLFKDLVADTIRDLADLVAGKSRATALPRRKLLF